MSNDNYFQSVNEGSSNNEQIAMLNKMVLLGTGVNANNVSGRIYRCGFYLNIYLLRDDKSLICGACGRRYKMMCYLTWHVKWFHITPMCYKCEICDQSFPKENLLNKHTRVVHEGPHQCNQCSERFTSKRRLQKHVDSVHLVNVCFECQITFPSSSALQKHLNSLKKCKYCGVPFCVKLNLISHLQSIHPEKELFQCHKCDTYYFKKSTLKNHVRAKHEEQQLYHCEEWPI